VPALLKKTGQETEWPPSGKRNTPAARPERDAGFALALTGKRRLRDSLLWTSSREGSTQIILDERLMVFDEPWLEVAVNNPG